MALMTRPQPPAESPEERYDRDYSMQQGDWQNDVNGNLVYSAPDTGNGRRNRTVNLRGGDIYYTYDVDGNPVEQLDEDGRNQREYVDYDTGVTAHAVGGVSERYATLAANSGAWTAPEPETP